MSKRVIFKAGNMKKEQDFVLYPYSGGATITLQSDKRFIVADLKTGKGRMNGSNVNYPNSIKLMQNPLNCEIPEETRAEIEKYLKENQGMKSMGGVVVFENKELFSTNG